MAPNACATAVQTSHRCQSATNAAKQKKNRKLMSLLVPVCVMIYLGKSAVGMKMD